MGQRHKQLLVFWIVCLVSLAGVFGITRDDAEAGDRPPLGPVIISPYMGDWYEYQRPIFRAGAFDLAKIHLPTGYATGPVHVGQLIDDGARVIMLKTEDCTSSAEKTRSNLLDRGFLDVIQQYPDIGFVVQVGNEPERCPFTMQQYFAKLSEVITEVKPVVDQPNLYWVAGLPMVPETAKQLLEEGWVQELYDGVGTNMLGHYSLTDEYHGWHEIVDYVLEETEMELWLTEIGINHPPMDKARKAERILEYVDQLPADRVGGVAIFTLGQGTDWPQYEVTEAMVPNFAGKEDCSFFVPTEQFLCDPFRLFWERHGGLPIFGYPVSEEHVDSAGMTVQFTERARFEHQPGVWPEQFDVLLSHLGRDLVRGREDELPFQSVGASAHPGEQCVYFRPTGQYLCDTFLEYWNSFGGLPVFGYPISQEFEENGFQVQYFERARFEHHPGVWPERYDVLQGLLGVQALEGTLRPESEH